MKWTEHIQEVHRDSRGTYGSPRVTVELKDRGVEICENTVAKLMKCAGLAARVRRRYVPQTTDSSHDCPIAPNRLGQDFAAAVPNRPW